MPEPERRTVAGPAGELIVWDHAGGAPAVLLLHGIGNYGRVWDFVATAVDGRLRLIAPDARGHGGSAKPATGGPKSIRMSRGGTGSSQVEGRHTESGVARNH